MDTPPFNGQSITYGDQIDDVSIGDPMKNLGVVDNRDDDVYRLWGHILNVTAGKIECTSCDLEHEIPDIVQKGSSHRAAIYRMYMFGEFRTSSCEPQMAEFTDPNPGTIIQVGNDQYRYTGGDKWVSMSPPHNVKRTSEIVREKQQKIEEQRSQNFVPSHLDNTTSRSDIGGPHYDATQPTVTWNTDLSEKEKKPLMEKITDRI